MNASKAAFLLFLITLSLCYVNAKPAEATENSWAYTADLSSLEKAKVVLNDLVGINVAAYNITDVNLINDAEGHLALALPEEDVIFTLENAQSSLRASCTFVNNTLLQIFLTEYIGSVSFNQPTTNVLDMAKGFLERYEVYTGNSFYGELGSMLDDCNINQSSTKTIGNVRLEIFVKGITVDFWWFYTSKEGVWAKTKDVALSYNRGLPYVFFDAWQFIKIGGDAKISSEEAIAIALKALRNFSYEASPGVTISQFKVAPVDEAIQTSLSYLNYQDNSTARGGNPRILYPSWWVGIGFDTGYPGSVSGVTVRIWADTGEVSSIGPMVYSGGAGPSTYATETTTPSIAILSPENKTYTTNDILLEFNASEPVSWVDYSLDRQANVTITGNTTISGNITLTGLSEGAHSLTVYVADAYGSTANVGTSETIYFTITQQSEPPPSEPEPQQSDPFPTTWIAVAAGIVAVAVVSSLIYLRRNRKTTQTSERPVSEAKAK